MRTFASLLFFATLALPQAAQAQQRVGIDFFAHVRSIHGLRIVDGKVLFSQRTADLRKDCYVASLHQLVGERDALVEDSAIARQYRRQDSAIVGPSHYYQTAPIRLEEPASKLPDSLLASDAGKRYRVFSELPFWSNGAGDVDGKRNVLYEIRDGRKTALTDSTASVNGIRLSDDKRWLAYTIVKEKSVHGFGNQLYVHDTRTGETRELGIGQKAAYSIARFEDASHLYASVQTDNETNPQANAALWLFDIAKGSGTKIYDASRYELGRSLLSDVKTGNHSPIVAEGHSLYFITTDFDYTALARLDVPTGKVSLLTPREVSVDEFLPYGKGWLLIATVGQGGQEVYFLDRKGRLEQRSHLNDRLFGQTLVSHPRLVEFTSTTGRRLRGYVLPPANQEPGRKYPAILDIHGGPKCAYGTEFFHEMQYWAGEGYAVLFANPQGSSGGGSDFAKLKGDFGVTDYGDLMAFVDAALEQVEFLDKDRLGVTGGSYGGIMANWIIGHTDLFRAAASQRSIANWTTHELLSDIGYSYGLRYAGPDPWQNHEELWRQSPLAYAHRVKTPTLFIHSEEDYRCPLPEGLQMYSALQYHGVPSRIVIFKHENHELSRNGRPLNRIKRLDEITRWFDRYLKN